MLESLTGQLKVKPLDTCILQIRKGSPELCQLYQFLTWGKGCPVVLLNLLKGWAFAGLSTFSAALVPTPESSHWVVDPPPSYQE